jgi:hypothetical protein
MLREITLKHGPEQSFVFESEILIEAARRGYSCRNIPIGVAPRIGPRGSHFRPVLDILRISRMVASKILARGLYLQGLWALVKPREDRSIKSSIS